MCVHSVFWCSLIHAEFVAKLPIIIFLPTSSQRSTPDVAGHLLGSLSWIGVEYLVEKIPRTKSSLLQSHLL